MPFPPFGQECRRGAGGGAAALAATASDNVAVTRVDVDGAAIGSDTSAPYGVDWDTSTVADGEHALARFRCPGSRAAGVADCRTRAPPQGDLAPQTLAGATRSSTGATLPHCLQLGHCQNSRPGVRPQLPQR